MSSSTEFTFDTAQQFLNNFPQKAQDTPALQNLNAKYITQARGASETLPTNSDFDTDLPLKPSLPVSPGLSASFTGERRGPSARTGPNLAALGSIIKRNKKFCDTTEAEFDTYTKTYNIEERMLIQFALSLEIRDMLREMQKPENWTISKDLKKYIDRYGKAFMLAPSITSYQGNSPEQILQLMRDENIVNLPSEKQAIETTEVLSAIGGVLTNFRSTMKSKIKDTLAPGADEDEKNIANLTDTIISNTGIPHTLQIYIRISFLRWVMKNYPKEAASSSYWVKVNDVLKQFREHSKDSQELTAHFNRIYQLDIETYGNPSVTAHSVEVPNKTSGSWFSKVDSYASRVTGGPSRGGKGKRRHVEVDDAQPA